MGTCSPLDKPDEKRETIPNLAPTEPPFAFGSGVLVVADDDVEPRG